MERGSSASGELERETVDEGAEGWCGWSKLTRGLPCSQRGLGGRGGSWSSLFLEGLEGGTRLQSETLLG